MRPEGRRAGGVGPHRGRTGAAQGREGGRHYLQSENKELAAASLLSPQTSNVSARCYPAPLRPAPPAAERGERGERPAVTASAAVGRGSLAMSRELPRARSDAWRCLAVQCSPPFNFN